jgi:hypothetical protein
MVFDGPIRSWRRPGAVIAPGRSIDGTERVADHGETAGRN